MDLFPRKSPDNGRRIVAALKEIGFALSEADELAIAAASRAAAPLDRVHGCI